jgi:predicted transcriptional regulator
MTTERLDRLETLAETMMLAIQQLAHQQQQLQQNLHDEVVKVVGMVNLMVQENGKVLERIDLMQSEIRGLQVENRRMIERWNSHTSDGHGGDAA